MKKFQEYVEKTKPEGDSKPYIKFTAEILPAEIQEYRKETEKTAKVYWSVVDSKGARFLIYSESLLRKIVIGKKINLTGAVIVGKGGTYLRGEKVTTGGECVATETSDDWIGRQKAWAMTSDMDITDTDTL